MTDPGDSTAGPLGLAAVLPNRGPCTTQGTAGYDPSRPRGLQQKQRSSPSGGTVCKINCECFTQMKLFAELDAYLAIYIYNYITRNVQILQKCSEWL